MSEAGAGTPATNEPIEPPQEGAGDEPGNADQPGLPDGPDGSIDAILERDHPFG